MLLTRSIKRKIWLVPLMVSILAYTTYIFVPSPVIVSFQNAGYVDKTENILSLLGFNFFKKNSPYDVKNKSGAYICVCAQSCLTLCNPMDSSPPNLHLLMS